MLCIKINKIKSSGGFTLIEVIVSLVVAGILGTILFAFMGTGVMNSANPVILVEKGAYLNEIMENMTADYIALQVTNPGPSGLNTFQSRVVSTSPYNYGLSASANVTTTYISFPTTGSNVDASNTTYNASSNNVLQVTVKYGGQSATTLFGG